jgi:hypothetical protein
MQFEEYFRMTKRHAQKGLRRSRGLTSALFPVLKRAGRDTEKTSKLLL